MVFLPESHRAPLERPPRRPRINADHADHQHCRPPNPHTHRGLADSITVRPVPIESRKRAPQNACRYAAVAGHGVDIAGLDLLATRERTDTCPRNYERTFLRDLVPFPQRLRPVHRSKGFLLSG